MKPTETPIIEYVFQKDGKEISSEKYITDSTYKYVSSKVLNEDRIKPKITDYSVSSPDGEDKTQYTFVGNKLLLIIFNSDKASNKNIEAIRNLVKGLEGKAECFILTASSEESINKFIHENQLPVPFYYADATVLKTIIRSNPGIALWKDGTVLGNWHHNDTPTAEEVLNLLK